MNKIIYLSRIIFLAGVFFNFSSCKKENTDPNLFSANKWRKFSIPEAGTVFSISGNVDEIYVSGFQYKAYYSLNQGKSWNVVAGERESSIIQSFLILGDSVFGLSCGFGYDSVACPSFYFLKNKREWQRKQYKVEDSRYWLEYNFYSPKVKSSRGDIYFLDYTKNIDKQQQLKRITRSDTILIETMPPKTYIRSLYIDSKDKLYLGMNQSVVDGKIASIYVSINPIP